MATLPAPPTSSGEPTVTISKKEFDELVADQDFLNALHVAGVDNWEGYDFAREFLDNDK
jgi:hypothetical protein